MALSIFEDKTHVPEPEELKTVLGDSYDWWREIHNYVYQKYPEAAEKWSYSGKKYGWNYSLKDKKRAIVYMIPTMGAFKVGMVYGRKGAEDALSLDISPEIKEIIKNARVYAEGRGFRIDVKDENMIEDVERLIDVKLEN